MSAITRGGRSTEGGGALDDQGHAVAGARGSVEAHPGAHPSWRFQDRFDLWVDWLQREGGVWKPHQSVLHRTFKTREETLLHAERFLARGHFPMNGGSGSAAAPMTLVRNRRDALLRAFREAEGDGVTLLREVQFPVGEYALGVKVTREPIAAEVRAAFQSAANPLRSLSGKLVKLTVLIEHPYDVLTRAQGLLEIGERAVRLGGEVQEFGAGTGVSGVPYRHATVTVSRGLLKKPLLYRYELDGSAAD